MYEWILVMTLRLLLSGLAITDFIRNTFLIDIALLESLVNHLDWRKYTGQDHHTKSDHCCHAILITHCPSVSLQKISQSIRQTIRKKTLSSLFLLLQISLNNFTLRIRPGYEQSTNSCAHCDYIASPILISRRLFVRAMQHSSLPSRLALLDLFVRLIHSGLDTITLPRAVVCPDVMFHMQHDPDQALTNVDKKTWTAFVNLWSLDRIRLFPDVEFVWTCYEARIHCEFYEKSEVQVPSCCLNEQHRCVIGFLSLTSKYQITTRVSGDYLTGLYGPVIGATLYQSLLNVVWNRSAHERIEKTAFRKEFYKKYGCKLFPAHLRKPTQQIVVSGPTRNWTIYGEFMAPVSETNEIKNVYSQQTKIWVHGIWTETNYNPGTMTPEYTHWEIESLFWSAELALIPLPFCGTYQLRMNCLIASYLPLGNIQYHDVDRYWTDLIDLRIL